MSHKYNTDSIDRALANHQVEGRIVSWKRSPVDARYPDRRLVEVHGHDTLELRTNKEASLFCAGLASAAQARPARLTIPHVAVSEQGNNLFAVTSNGEFAAALRWVSDDEMRMCDEDGVGLASLHLVKRHCSGHRVEYRYTAILALNGDEIARAARLEDACRSVLAWKADRVA